MFLTVIQLNDRDVATYELQASHYGLSCPPLRYHSTEAFSLFMSPLELPA